MGAFGEKLRKQREQRGLALDTISNTTKISTRMLRALEEEHFEQLPGGVFNKGFVRAYARQVGLDEEETISAYLEALRESQEHSQNILPDFHIGAGQARQTAVFASRKHTPPASDDAASEISTEERRRNEDRRNEERRNEQRRNDIRRTDDRAAKTAVEAIRNPVTAEISDQKDPKVNQSSDRVTRAHDAATLLPVAARGEDDHASTFDEREQSSQKSDRGRDFETQSRDTTSMAGFITAGEAAESESNHSPETSSRFPASRKRQLAAALLLLTIGLSAWLLHWHQDSASKTDAVNNPASSGAAVPAAVPSISPTSEAGTAGNGVSSDASTPTEKASPTPPPKIVTSTSANQPKRGAYTSARDRVEKPLANSALANSSPATFSLTIRAEQTTWISITADGKPVAHETLIAPAHTSIRAMREITVKVGNAAGVSFVHKGKEYPAQGNAGEVKTYNFDATGMETAPAAAAPNP